MKGLAAAAAVTLTLVPAHASARLDDRVTAANRGAVASTRSPATDREWRARVVGAPFKIVEVLPPTNKLFTIRGAPAPKGDFTIIEVVPPKVN